MILALTGTRYGMTLQQQQQVTSILQRLQPDSVVHGGCRGADTDFHGLVLSYQPQMPITIYPGDATQAAAPWPGLCDVRPVKPYLRRNKDIVNTADTILATPRGFREELRSGTWAAIRFAEKVGKPIFIIYPDGTVTSLLSFKS